MQFKMRVLNKVKRHGHWKAFSVKAHGRRSKDQVHALENYQRNTSIPVILVSEQADHIPRFEALNRYLKWRTGIVEKYKKKAGIKKC